MTTRHAAVLLCDPAAPCLDAPLLRAAAALLRSTDVQWLCPGVAAEVLVACRPPDRAPIEGVLRELVRGRPVDVALLPADGRRKRLLLADMDSTMIEQECLDELAGEFGLKERIAAITERAMRGEIAFEPALRERVAALAGLDAAAIDRVLGRITPMPGARTLVRTMREAGAYTALVSGGFTAFTGPVSGRIGFDEHRGNLLLLAGAAIAGRVAEPILGRAAKLEALLELRGRLGLAHADTLAVGDGANDLAMLGEAGFGVAFHAKPAVADAAGIRIDHGDLTALLYLQGFRRAEFAAV